MKVVVFEKYGPSDVLRIKETENPKPKDDEILIRIHSTTVIKGDCDLRRFDVPKWIWLPLRLYMGIFKPRVNILGQEYSGTIESVGKNVKRFEPGDKILGPTSMKFGAYAQYLCIKSNFPIVRNPQNWNFQQSSTLAVGGLNALHLLRKADVNEGMHVLITGAGGSIGSYAIQISKEWGAHVTAIDAGNKLEKIRDFGADHLLDYTDSKFSLRDNAYDVIIDLVGTYQNNVGLNALKKSGIFIQGNPSIRTMASAIFQSRKNKVGIKNTAAGYRQEDLEYLRELAERGKLSPYIDQVFQLEEMQKAHFYVETGQKIGHVVVEIN